MKTSARNQFKASVSHLQSGAVNSEVIMQLSTNNTLVATITNSSIERLQLKKGDHVCALIKASTPLLFIATDGINYSARNTLLGDIVEVEHGAVHTQVCLDLGNNQLLVAMITRTSAQDMALTPGMKVGALVKASQVMLTTQSD